MSASIFPLQGVMLICNGCGGERHVPQHEVDRIDSVEAFKKFADRRIGLYACQCGAKTCDIRLTPSVVAQEEMRVKKDDKT